jgi:hypothetical protein
VSNSSRARAGDHPRQAQHPSRGCEEAALDLGKPEEGVVGRNDQVAGEHDFATAGQSRPVDRGDHRLRARIPGEAGEAPASLDDRRALAGGEGLQIHAGAKRPVAASGENGHQGPAIGFEPVKRRAQRSGRRAVDRVALGRTVERDGRDAVACLVPNRLLHGACPAVAARQPATLMRAAPAAP